jgi:hypothetical protein
MKEMMKNLYSEIKKKILTQFTQKRLGQSSENKVCHRKKISDCVLQFVSLKSDVRELRNNVISGENVAL